MYVAIPVWNSAYQDVVKKIMQPKNFGKHQDKDGNWIQGLKHEIFFEAEPKLFNAKTDTYKRKVAVHFEDFARVAQIMTTIPGVSVVKKDLRKVSKEKLKEKYAKASAKNQASLALGKLEDEAKRKARNAARKQAKLDRLDRDSDEKFEPINKNKRGRKKGSGGGSQDAPADFDDLLGQV